MSDRCIMLLLLLILAGMLLLAAICLRYLKFPRLAGNTNPPPTQPKPDIAPGKRNYPTSGEGDHPNS